MKQTLFNQIYSIIGWALCNAQGLENTLAKFIILAFELNVDTSTEDAIAKLNKLDDKTLGRLITELRKRADLPEDISDRLRKFNEDRIWLAHKCYADVVEVVFNNKEPKLLLDRLIAVGVEGRQLHQMLYADTAELASTYHYLQQNPDFIPIVQEKIKEVFGEDILERI